MYLLKVLFILLNNSDIFLRSNIFKFSELIRNGFNKEIINEKLANVKPQYNNE